MNKTMHLCGILHQRYFRSQKDGYFVIVVKEKELIDFNELYNKQILEVFSTELKFDWKV